MGALMLDRKEISELEASIQAYRVGIRRLSTEVRGIMNAVQRLTSRYFPGLNIVFRSGASALNELAASVGLLAEDYNKLVGFVAGAKQGWNYF
jgi:hypothetical protein